MIRSKNSAEKPGRQWLEREEGNRGKDFMEAMQRALDRVKMACSIRCCLKAKKNEKRNISHLFMDKEVIGNLGKSHCITKGEGKSKIAVGREWVNIVCVDNSF